VYDKSKHPFKRRSWANLESFFDVRFGRFPFLAGKEKDRLRLQISGSGFTFARGFGTNAVRTPLARE